MTSTPLQKAFVLALACVALHAAPTLAQAQTPVPEPAAPVLAPIEASGTAAAPVPPENCRAVSDRAMAADLRAANAQAQKTDATQMARLLDDAIGLWTQATERCTDRAQERARRNLADSQRTRQALNAELGSGPECAIRQKDATSLQDLAQQAVKERRWTDAAVTYRKAENMWDVAAESCQGEPQRIAQQKRDQTAIDAHNAEHCAPHFERAREASQALNRPADAGDKAARQTQSQVAETLWREAMGQCKGSPQDIARNNAQRLAKERGTPWVPTVAPDAPPLATTTAPAPVATAAAAAKTATTPLATAAVGSASATGAGALKGASALAGGQALQTPAAANVALPPPSTGPQDMDIQSGDTRFQGRFERQDNLLSGSGRVSWANGDVYNGELAQGKRHGQGEFVWANGQRYKGTWVQDVPHGTGSMAFASGNRYEGDIAHGEPHGTGRMVFASGDTFQGPFVKGKPNGQGTYRWANGQTYEGPWTREQANGVGKLLYANGNRYEGSLVNGTPEGQGKLAYASGDEYLGQFKQGNPHGEGTYVWKSGERFTGQWQDGRKHGQGRFEWSTGDRWDGLFENDAQTDKGTLTRKAP